MTASIIRFDNVAKRFGDLVVLDRFNFEVAQGEKVTLIGPSGSGKSTVLRILMTLEPFQDGEVTIAGVPYQQPNGRGPFRASEQHLRQIRANVGMVFQSFNLFPHKTVLQNVTLAPRYHGRLTGTALDESGMRLLAKVGMAAHAHKYPHQLSGGQQQRIAIARALAMQPSIVLFDEPTSALDPELVNEVLKVIEGLAQEGMTMIIVTHEINFAFRISDRIVFMEAGMIVSDAPPRELATLDKTSRIASFLKDVHLA
jgi:polar amino acid transport system permease protein